MSLSYGTIGIPIIPQKLPQVQIDSLGNANATIDIDLPPGTRNLVPNLQIIYSSGSGNGLLGRGWNLVGLSNISRVSEDNRIVAEFSSSEVGKLKYNSSTGFFHSTPESFNKFVPNEQTNPSYWTKTDKSEVVSSYGISTDSIIQSDIYGVLWGLTQVRDSYGNGYSVKYQNQMGVLLPIEINYNENKTVISFEYSLRNDIFEQYYLGIKQTYNQILSSIKIINDGVLIKEYNFKYNLKNNVSRLNKLNLTNQEPINFTYADDNSFPNIPVSHQFRNVPINYMQLLEGPDQAWCSLYETACIASAIQGPMTPVKVLASLVCRMYYKQMRNHCSFGQENSRILYADTNGDQIPELISVGRRDRYYFAIHQPDGTIIEKGFSRSIGDPTSKLQLIPGDIDGNFKSDIFILEDNNASLKVANLDRDQYKTFPSIKVNLSESSNMAEKYRNYNFVTDFNGDGKTDFILYRDNQLKVFLNQTVTNNKLQNSPTADAENKNWQLNEYTTLEFNKPYGTTLQTFFDLDRNGTSDFIRLNHNKIFVSFYKDKKLIREIEKEIFTTELSGNQYFADVNGDGYIDFISYDGEKFNIYFFDGINFKDNVTNIINNVKELKDPGLVINQVGPPCDGQECIDVNGDGFKDKLEFDSRIFNFGPIDESTFENNSIDTVYKGGLLRIRLYDPRTRKYEITPLEASDFSNERDLNWDGVKDIISYEALTLAKDKTEGNSNIINLKLTIHVNGRQPNTLPIVDIGHLNPKQATPPVSTEILYDNWRHTRTFVDMNADGKADFVWYDGTKIYVSYSIGTTPDNIYNPNGDTSFNAEAFHGVADMNLDGKLDFIGVFAPKAQFFSEFEFSNWTNFSCHSGSGQFHIYYSTALDRIPNLLTNINDNKFKSISLKYGSENQNPDTIDMSGSSNDKLYYSVKSKAENKLTTILMDQGGGFTDSNTYSYNNHLYFKTSENKFADSGYQSILVTTSN